MKSNQYINLMLFPFHVTFNVMPLHTSKRKTQRTEENTGIKFILQSKSDKEMSPWRWYQDGENKQYEYYYTSRIFNINKILYRETTTFWPSS